MKNLEREVRCGFRDIDNGFLGNNKNPNYKQTHSKLIESYENLGGMMLLQVDILR